MKVSRCFWKNVSYKMLAGVHQPMVLLFNAVWPCEWWELNCLFLGSHLCHITSERPRTHMLKDHRLALAIFIFPRVFPRAVAMGERPSTFEFSLEKNKEKGKQRFKRENQERSLRKRQGRCCEECHKITQEHQFPPELAECGPRLMGYPQTCSFILLLWNFSWSKSS